MRKPKVINKYNLVPKDIQRAIILKPKILLLDEPLSALDLKLRQNMQYELKEMQRNLGITFIFVTHDQEEAMSISDLIVVMKLGVVQQIDEPQKVYDNPVNLFVANFLGTPPINILPSLSRLMKDGIGEGYTREDHQDLANQLFSSYARVGEARALASVIGEDELSALLSRNAREFITGTRKDTAKEDNQLFLNNLLALGLTISDEEGFNQGGSSLKNELKTMKTKFRLKNQGKNG